METMTNTETLLAPSRMNACIEWWIQERRCQVVGSWTSCRPVLLVLWFHFIIFCQLISIGLRPAESNRKSNSLWKMFVSDKIC